MFSGSDLPIPHQIFTAERYFSTSNLKTRLSSECKERILTLSVNQKMDLGESKNYSYQLQIIFLSFLPKGPNKTKIKYDLAKIREIPWTLIFRGKYFIYSSHLVFPRWQRGSRKKNAGLDPGSFKTVGRKTAKYEDNC